MDHNAFSRRRFLGNGLTLGTGLVLGSSLLSACGDGAAPDAKIIAAPNGPQYGGRLRLGIIDGTRSGNLDAHKPVGSGIIRGFALYSKLWEWDENMLPRLALAEEAEVSSDARTWTLRLHKGLEFHNGKTIDADDLIFSVRRLTDPQLASPYAALLHWIDRDNLEKLDERTIRVRFKDGAGFVPLPETWVNFGGIVPVDYHPVTNPVGAGPYKLKSFNPGQRSLFSRFENYYKAGKPYADELEIIDFKDQTSRLAALQAGQIDMANGLANEQLRLVQANPKLQVLSSVTGNWLTFDMNLSKPPFDDPRVRQAFRLMADREELVARALNGQGRVANDLYAPYDPTFDHSIAQRTYNLEQAKALLREAGQENLSVELIADQDSSAVSSALVFAEQAKRAGVDIRVRQVDSATFEGPQHTEWPLSTGGSIGAPFLTCGLHSDAPVSVANKTHFSDPRFDELFLQALAQPDLEKRRVLVHEAQRIQHEKGGMLIWGFANLLDGVASHVGGAHAEKTLFATWRFDNLWLKEQA